jgi:hypothetical protein
MQFLDEWGVFLERRRQRLEELNALYVPGKHHEDQCNEYDEDDRQKHQ